MVDVWIFFFEGVLGFVVVVEWCDIGYVDIVGFEFVVIVFDCLFECEVGKVVVGLFDLWDFWVFDIDVEGDDFDVGIDGVLGCGFY